MNDKILILYCIVDDLLKALEHREDPRRQMEDAEVITTGLVAALWFGGNIEKARSCLWSTQAIPDMLGKSRLCRRLHAVRDLIAQMFLQLGTLFKNAHEGMEYVVDSVPVPICDNIRIPRSRLVRGEAYRGYIKAKRRYFYGVRIHILATTTGLPVEFIFMPGAPHDSQALFSLPLDLPPGSTLFGDSGYTNYTVEDDLADLDQIRLSPLRKRNSQRADPDPGWRLYKTYMRKRIETLLSGLTSLFPKHIHAVTFEGFLLKLMLFITGYTLDQAFC